LTVGVRPAQPFASGIVASAPTVRRGGLGFMANCAQFDPQDVALLAGPSR
jgi:hypothetical protein